MAANIWPVFFYVNKNNDILNAISQSNLDFLKSMGYSEYHSYHPGNGIHEMETFMLYGFIFNSFRSMGLCGPTGSTTDSLPE